MNLIFMGIHVPHDFMIEIEVNNYKKKFFFLVFSYKNGKMQFKNNFLSINIGV